MVRIEAGLLLLAFACLACSAGGSEPADPGPADASGDPGFDAGMDPDPAGEFRPDATPDLAQDPAPDLSDAGMDPGSGPLIPWVGRVHLEERYVPNQGPFGSHVSVMIRDLPDPIVHDLVAETGGCRYFRSRTETACSPDCPKDQFCTLDGECRPWPRRLSAGVITLSGLKTPLTATPDDTGWYSVLPEPPDDLFDPKAELTVSATGAEIPAFEARVRGVADMEPGWTGEVKMVDGQPIHLSWPKKGDGARVEVVFQIGWHGKPPTDIIWCEADEAAGGVEIPASFVDQFPPWSGEGLFQNPSWARRVSRTIVPTPAGPVEVRATSQVGIYIVH